MKITLFTSNQRRHATLINMLAQVAEEVFVIQEVNSIRPGIVKDFYDNSETMGRYFRHVIAAENEIFGTLPFLANNVRSMSIKFGDLNDISLSDIDICLHSDVYVVFGASWIRGDLAQHLIDHDAINIHMGVAPFYKGSSCNFWACYDSRPDLVGATIHRLAKGLDNGPILYHVIPKPQETDPFPLGMQAVKAAFECLQTHLRDGSLFKTEPIEQIADSCIRYTRNADFTSEIAETYLTRNLKGADIMKMFENKRELEFIRPYIF